VKRSLTDAKVKNLKHKDKSYKTSDGGGLYILTTRAGGKSWRYDFKLNDKYQTLVIGQYPQKSLSEARKLHELARMKLSQGLNPTQASDTTHLEKPFSVHALDAIHRQELSDRTAKKKTQAMEKYLFKALDRKQVNQITAVDLLNLLQPLVDTNLIETARRLATYCRQTFDNLLALQLITSNPAESINRLLPKLPPVQNYAHVTDEKDFAIILNGTDNHQGDFAVRKALQLMPLVFLRPHNIRFMKWEHIDFEEKLITIPADVMKMKRPHKVPLSKQAISILEEMHALTGQQELVFTVNGRTKEMSENTLNNAITRFKHPKTGKSIGKGFMSSHGFRHTASTMLNELGFNSDAVELQLAHLDKDRIRRTYNKSELMPIREKMMQAWANHLDGLKDQKKAIPINRKLSRG
jgi:integrase